MTYREIIYIKQLLISNNNSPNKNGRIYPNEVLQKAADGYKKLIKKMEREEKLKEIFNNSLNDQTQ